MEIRDLAQAVLTADRLEDKLLEPIGPLTDRRPGPALAEAPAAPGRPPALRLDNGRPRARFPGPGQLVAAEARGRALHFFANHELLAMELMALVLLRFPEAPAGFRRGVAHTLLEEQDHLRRYRRRMEALGVGLGDVPVSDFFWSTMADMRSPVDYVVRMSMTFEQANLDHARHYAALFREVSDRETADLMDLVYEEELGHVRHGVTWFNRWRHDTAPHAEESDWAAYRRLLPPPLSARRARGQPFLLEARRQVGLSEDFARSLEVYSQSRGRPPAAWIFEPGFEAELSPQARRPSPAARRVAQDLAPVLMFVAASDDVVVTPARPSQPVLTRLARAGFEVPEFLEASAEGAGAALAGRTISAVHGWGETRAVRAARAAVGLAPGEAPPVEASSKIWAAIQLAELSSACPSWRPLLGPDLVVGRPCGDPVAVDTHRRALAAAGFAKLIVKQPFSTSGQARRRYATDDPLDDPWLQRAIAAGPVLVEPWLDRRADLSILLEVTDRDLDPEAAPQPLRQKRPRVAAMPFLTSASGVYRGHVLAAPTFGLPAPWSRALAFGADGGLAGRLAELGAFVRHRLAGLGHRGPAAVDLLVFAGSDVGPRVKPIVEINARRTMGHVAAALRSKVAPGRFGVWLHRPLQPGDAERASVWPALATRTAGRRAQLDRGLLATTDPSTARQVWSVLAVGRDLADVRALLTEGLDVEAIAPLDRAYPDL